MIEASVVIATYNRAESLRRCLEALCRQTMPMTDFEVVVVVDGSTDGTQEMLGSFQPPYALRVVEQVNCGQSVAFNRGIAVARGRVTIFLDDDITVAPEFVAAHIRLHQEREGVIGIGRLALTLPPGADWFARCFAESWADHYAAFDVRGRQPSWRDCYCGNMSGERDLFLAVGGFATMPRCNDIELGYRLAEHGCSFVYLPLAQGIQDERKGMVALTGDSERAGIGCVEIYRRHPATLTELLGRFSEQRPGMAAALRVLLAADIEMRHLRSAGSLLNRLACRKSVYDLLQRYSYWTGVRHALSDQGEWQQLMGGTPILMYHAFSDRSEPPSRYVIPISRFAQQMDWLERAGYSALSMGELVGLRRQYRLPPARSVVITIDDGYADTWRLAYPVLRRHGFSATVFLVSDLVEDVSRWDGPDPRSRRALLSWANIGEMLQGGIEFGAHTRTHPDLTAISAQQAREEIEGCRETLERALGLPIRLFSYPYGRENSAVRAMVEQAGFIGSCGISNGLNGPSTPLDRLQRVEVRGNDSMVYFGLAVRTGARPGWLLRRVRSLITNAATGPREARRKRLAVGSAPGHHRRAD